MFYVYILKSLKTGKYYIGQTNNLDRRFRDHNRGKDRSSKIGMPWEIVYSEVWQSRNEAIKRERQLKLLKSRAALEKIINAAG